MVLAFGLRKSVVYGVMLAPDSLRWCLCLNVVSWKDTSGVMLTVVNLRCWK